MYQTRDYGGNIKKQENIPSGCQDGGIQFVSGLLISLKHIIMFPWVISTHCSCNANINASQRWVLNLVISWSASRMAHRVKNLSARQEIREAWVLSPDQEDPLEKEMATHFSILALEILWTKEPGGLRSIGSQRVGHDWVNKHEGNSTMKIRLSLFCYSTKIISHSKCIFYIYFQYIVVSFRDLLINLALKQYICFSSAFCWS